MPSTPITLHDPAMAERYALLRQRMDAAARAAGRDPAGVALLPVSKTFPVMAVRDAHALGLHAMGENRAQDLRAKADALRELDLSWVMLGHLQTNKAKDVARYAHELQSLDRWELAEALQRRLDQEGRTLRVLIQVKTSPELSKTGIAPDEVLALARRVRDDAPRLQLQGLMTVAVNAPDDEAAVRACFARLRALRDALQAEGFDEVARLSMGMSGDFELAIAEGATEVRVGSALFGARDYSQDEGQNHGA